MSPLSALMKWLGVGGANRRRGMMEDDAVQPMTAAEKAKIEEDVNYLAERARVLEREVQGLRWGGR